ncbi:MAG: DoxX family membrane protein [bacterium]
MSDRSARARDWALLALRLAIGITFIIHGYPKLERAEPDGSWISCFWPSPSL